MANRVAWSDRYQNYVFRDEHDRLVFTPDGGPYVFENRDDADAALRSIFSGGPA